MHGESTESIWAFLTLPGVLPPTSPSEVHPFHPLPGGATTVPPNAWPHVRLPGPRPPPSAPSGAARGAARAALGAGRPGRRALAGATDGRAFEYAEAASAWAEWSGFGCGAENGFQDATQNELLLGACWRLEFEDALMCNYIV